MDELTSTPTAVREGEWAVRWRPLRQARLRLFCLPHAGGGAAFFRSWAQRLGPEIEVVAIRLPGRENRFRERPYDRLDDLLPPLVRSVAPLLDRPHAWLGHSMGAGIAFEICRTQRRLGLPDPVRLLAAASPAPHLPRRETPVHNASAPELFVRLGQLQGTSSEALRNEALLNVMLPTLRADFAVAETHVHRPGPPLDCPITVYGGQSDESAVEEELDAWCRHSTADTTVRIFPGGHFFLHEAPDRFLPVLENDLVGRGVLPPHLSSGRNHATQ